MNKYYKAIKYKILHSKKNVFNEESTICGRKLITHPGTIRKIVDQDDAWFFHLAKENEIIFDIGCNIGYTAILAMLQNPNRQYLLVDPNTEAMAMANRNLTINNLGLKAYYFPGFVSDKNDDNVKFYTVGVGAAGSMSPDHAVTASILNEYSYVKTVTLDFLYDLYDIKPNLVKIDIEGAEVLAMDGATKLARESKCMFFIEMHSLPNLSMEEAGDKMIEWCEKNDYNVWYLRSQEKLSSGKMIKGVGKCHLLLIDKEKEFPNYLKSIKPNSELPKFI
jgi:FkbM family methyltransferase